MINYSSIKIIKNKLAVIVYYNYIVIQAKTIAVCI